MLASVANVHEARCLLPVGVDILDIKDPRKGALGAVSVRSVTEIVNAVSGRILTSATIGDLPMQPDLIDKGLTEMWTTGVDIVKVGIFATEITTPVLDVLCKHAQSEAKIVLVFFADLKPVLNEFSHLADAGMYGVMLDTADKTGRSLRSIMQEDALRSFVHTAKAQGLMTGLAGSLQVSDIQPLLGLKPDYLGFRGALCSQGQRQMAINVHAARNVRELIPANSYPSLLRRGRVKRNESTPVGANSFAQIPVAD
jgi:dihydroneopterin aldolase